MHRKGFLSHKLLIIILSLLCAVNFYYVGSAGLRIFSDKMFVHTTTEQTSDLVPSELPGDPEVKLTFLSAKDDSPTPTAENILVLRFDDEAPAAHRCAY